jgi:hypothetical protein
MDMCMYLRGLDMEYVSHFITAYTSERQENEMVDREQLMHRAVWEKLPRQTAVV